MIARALVAVVACAAPALAQGHNVELLGRLNPGGLFSDVWGWAGNGQELALLCGTDELVVIDVTDGRAPRVARRVPGPSSSWRDVKTWGAHAYVISEGGPGLQIVDLTDPGAPVLDWGAQHWNNAHKLAVDAARGLAFVCGTNRGMFVLDLTQNPTAPVLLAQYANGYVHDLHAQNGLAYAAVPTGSWLRILDVAQPRLGLFELSDTPTPGGLAHGAWASPDDALCITVDEVVGGPIAAFDVTDPRAPVLLSTLTIAPAVMPHNVFLHDSVVHLAHYTEGYQVIDYSDPRAPVVVGWYDTYLGPSGGFNGAWGCYPFLPSGNVLIGDMRSGLWVFRPLAMATRYGAATPGANGAARLDPFGSGHYGNKSFALEIDGAAANAAAVLLVATQPVAFSVLGVTLHLDPATLVGSALLVTDATGRARATLPLPSAGPAAPPVPVVAQAVIAEPAGFAATSGLALTLFPR